MQGAARLDLVHKDLDSLRAHLRLTLKTPGILENSARYW